MCSEHLIYVQFAPYVQGIVSDCERFFIDGEIAGKYVLQGALKNRIWKHRTDKDCFSNHNLQYLKFCISEIFDERPRKYFVIKMSQQLSKTFCIESNVLMKMW